MQFFRKCNQVSHLKRNAGFTLIELMVVISIIALLATIILSSTNRARAKARDARRIAHLNSIAKALELYYAQNGQYAPEAASACDSSRGALATCPGAGTTWVAGGISSIAPAFIPVVPVDPTNSATYYYAYEPVDGNSPSPTQFGKTCSGGPLGICAYMLSTQLEDATSRYLNPGCDPCNAALNYCVAGGGARLNVAGGC